MKTEEEIVDYYIAFTDDGKGIQVDQLNNVLRAVRAYHDQFNKSDEEIENYAHKYWMHSDETCMKWFIKGAKAMRDGEIKSE